MLLHLVVDMQYALESRIFLAILDMKTYFKVSAAFRAVRRSLDRTVSIQPGRRLLVYDISPGTHDLTETSATGAGRAAAAVTSGREAARRTPAQGDNRHFAGG